MQALSSLWHVIVTVVCDVVKHILQSPLLSAVEYTYGSNGDSLWCYSPVFTLRLSHWNVWRRAHTVKITLNAAITKIGNEAFLYSGISNIFCLAATPPTLGDYALNFDSELAVKVPSSAVSAYQSSWGTNYSRMTISAGDPTSATTAANSGSTTHWATFSNTYSDSELSVEAGKYQ